MAKRTGRSAPVGPKNGGRAPGKGRKAKAKKKSGARHSAQGKARRNHKDSLFCRLFAEKENALSLYNALTGSSYTSADGLEIVTLENAVYLSQKNDCAVCVQSSLALFEQQSSWNPNMPLRGFLYFAAEYEGWLAKNTKYVYSGNLVKIPSPVYFVLYNGTEKQAEKIELRLSDAFEKPSEGYEWTAHVVNVNAEHNARILSRCQLLGEYADFIADVRQEQSAGKPLTKAVDLAVDRSIMRGGKLSDFMRKHKAEVKRMYLFEYDAKLHDEVLQEEAFENGLAKALRNLMVKLAMTAEQAMDTLDIPAAEREKYAAKLAGAGVL